VYSLLQLTEQDFISASALQAFLGRLFSVCSMLTAVRCNQMGKSLKIHM